MSCSLQMPGKDLPPGPAAPPPSPPDRRWRRPTRRGDDGGDGRGDARSDSGGDDADDDGSGSNAWASRKLPSHSPGPNANSELIRRSRRGSGTASPPASRPAGSRRAAATTAGP